MDTCEATNILISKIRTLDPENAYKIMGYILIQDLAERDLLNLALAPEPILQNVILKAKIHLGLSSNTLSTPTTPCSPCPPLNSLSRVVNSNNSIINNNHNHNNNNNNNPFPLSSPRLINNGGFLDFGKNPSSPHPWPPSGLPPHNSAANSVSPKSSPLLSYDNIRSGSALVPPLAKNVGNVGGDCGNNSADFLDETQLDDYLSFLDDASSKNEDFMDPRVQFDGFSVNNGDTHLHRRRFSESDVYFGGEDGGFGMGFKPCLYFARGFCKNGDNCKFSHGDFCDNMAEVNGPGVFVGSPREMEELYLQQQEMMRMKAAHQQQRLAYSKYMNFLLQQQNDPQRLGAAAALMGDEFHKLGRFRPERNDFFPFGMGDRPNSASRQIYLTFPADSSFKDEDVSNYFSTFGPVQDVRIPYQQKRMFGFVTFVHSETVKLILARGNPHFICDSRVLVKPYKEKGKLLSKAQQLLERGNFSPGSSPSGLDPRELYDLQAGPRMLYSNTQEMVLMRKLEEQAEMQQAIELQGRRLINLQLPDLRGDYVPHHQRSLSVGAPVSQDTILASDVKNQEVLGDNVDSSAPASCLTVAAVGKNIQEEVNAIENSNTVKSGEENLHECGSNRVHVLPNSIFSSPDNLSGNRHPDCSPTLGEDKENNLFPATSSSENNAPMTTISCDIVPH